MRKKYFVVATILIITFFYQAWSVVAGTNSPINQDLAYPPPKTTIQPTNSLGVQNNSTSNSYPAPGMSSGSQSPLITTIAKNSSYPPPPPMSGNPSVSESISGPYHVYLPILFKPYDRVAAANYADTFAHDRSSEFPSYGTGCNNSCVDCTNFVSKSLYKGGMALRTGTWNAQDSYEWWYKANYIGPIFINYTNSNTWSATDWMNMYGFNFPNDFEYRGWPDQLEAGDFFLMDIHGANPGDPPDGIPDHARFIVGYGNSSVDPADYTCQTDPTNPIPPSTYTLLADSHCTDRRHVAWDFNIQGVPTWSWHVKH